MIDLAAVVNRERPEYPEDLRDLLLPGRFIVFYNGDVSLLLVKTQETDAYGANMPTDLYAVGESGYVPINDQRFDERLCHKGTTFTGVFGDPNFDIVAVYRNINMGRGLKRIFKDFEQHYKDHLIWRRPEDEY